MNEDALRIKKYLAGIGVKFRAEGCAKIAPPIDYDACIEEQLCFVWWATFERSRNGHPVAFTTRYLMGLAHAKGNKPTPPKAADVLDSLIRDAAANNESFAEWCFEMGANKDSIRSLSIYMKCCETARQLSRFFNVNELAHLQKLTQEY